jgi:hypothetical protein
MATLLHVPLTISPEQLDRCWRVRDGARERDPVLEQASTALRTAQTALSQIVELKAAYKADNTPPSQAAVAIAQAARKAAERLAPMLDRARAGLAAERAAVDTATRAPGPVAAEGMLDAAVRQGLLTMTVEERLAAIADALDRDDDAILRPALGAPAAALGLARERHSLLTEQFRNKRHPEASARLGALDHAAEVIRRAGDGLIGFVEKTAADEAESRVQRIERAQAAVAAPITEPVPDA